MFYEHPLTIRITTLLQVGVAHGLDDPREDRFDRGAHTCSKVDAIVGTRDIKLFGGYGFAKILGNKDIV